MTAATEDPTPGLHFCPASREVESATGGGFATCCDRPQGHLPMPDTEATAAVSEALSGAAKAEFKLRQRAEQAEARVGFVRELCALHDAGGTPLTTVDVRDWLDRPGCGGTEPLRTPATQASAVAGPATTAKQCGYIRERWDGPYRMRDGCIAAPGHTREHGPWVMEPSWPDATVAVAGPATGSEEQQ